jgi:hypothetical protein
MARVVRFHEHGGPEVLRIEHLDLPGPARGEIQIRVKALGLNRAEALLRSGAYIEPARFPSGLGWRPRVSSRRSAKASRALRQATPSASCRRFRWCAGPPMASS